VTIVLVVYGIAIVAMALVIVGLVHRLMVLEANAGGGAREAIQAVPDWIAGKITGEHSHHLVVVVDDSCSICHRTVVYLDDAATDRFQLTELVTVLANAESFQSARVPVLFDPGEHRALHPGWAPAGLIFSARGLVEAVPVGSEESIEHALDRMSLLTATAA
jgi:hypothetical protein